MNIYSDVIIRPDYSNKDGQNPVCLRLTINRKVKMISLKMFVLATHWDSNKSMCRKTAPTWFKLNTLIEQAKQRADLTHIAY